MYVLNYVYLKQNGKADFLDHLSPQEILFLDQPMLFDSFGTVHNQ